MGRKPKPPVITLTTDFGTGDYFVGVMKGVILSINPDAKIVDISHEISPFNIREGGFLLSNSYSYFPEKTVHLVVVDPGVGSRRRPIIAKTKRYFFVAPDNGILSYIYKKENNIEVYEITNSNYFLKPVSQTFHGRDIFASVAAHISKGISCNEFGKRINDFTSISINEPVIRKNIMTGEIVCIDRFGNLITNISKEDFESSLLQSKKKKFEIKINNIKIRNISDSYSSAKDKNLGAIWGSHGYLELFSREANAGEKFRIKPKAKISVAFL